MTTQFDRPMVGFRFVETQRGDSLQIIAARELGDAARWIDIVGYNNLVPPFITDEPSQAGPGVVLTGAMVLVPAPSPVISSTLDPEQVFGIDVSMERGGQLAIENGDFALVSGRANLRQALKNRIETEVGELIYHVTYGSRIRQILGTVNGPTASLLSAQYAKSTVLADPRISRIERSVGAVSGDVVSVTVDAIPVSGKSVQITAQI